MKNAYIIGTGPGDEDLLTLKATKILRKCTAVLYDRLVPNNILNYLNDECEIYYCGKEPGCHYKTQQEINNMMIELINKGHVVGRIKGGDPYVFGRGGEEILALIEEEIDFEVVPGVTSPIAVLNYAGIPVTHRGISQSFHIVTGMSSSDLNINFEVLAKENGTLIFMMGLENIEFISEQLIKNHKIKETPCAVIMRGASAKQKKVSGTLEDIARKVRAANLKSPCIIVVGDVVNFNDKFNWYERLPLFGANICVTRSKDQSVRLKEKLTELGAEVTEINSIKIKSTNYNLEENLYNLEFYDHIILTSVNGVNMFFDYLIEKKYDVRKLKAKFSVIGNATKKALEKRGIVPFVVSKDFIAEGLFKELKPHLNAKEKVLIPCSNESRDYLKKEIEKLNLKVDKVATYTTLCGELKNKKAFEEVDIVLHSSPSCVRNMIKIVGRDNLRKKRNIAIGPQTLNELNTNMIEANMCKVHLEDSFIDEVTNIWKDIRRN